MTLTLDLLDRIPYRSGSINAKYVFVGEAPGADEERHPQKLPFVGASGNLLKGIIQAAGISLNECYFSNLLKERPPDNKFGKFTKENPQLLQTYIQLLSGELSLLKDANIFVAVGGEALHALTGKSSIEKWRGSILPATLEGIAGRKCIGIIHTAAILREWLYRPATVEDLKRIREEGKSPWITLPKREYLIRPSFDTVVSEIDRIKKSTLPFAVDIETLPGYIVSVQLSDNPERAICIPFQYRNGDSYWTLEQEIVVWRMLANLLEECGEGRIVGQNFCTFDVFMLAIHGIKWKKVLSNMLVDTMEAFNCVQPELPAGLDFLTSIYSKEPYYKDEGKSWKTRQGEEEFWTYGCKDVMVDEEIAPQLINELRETKLWDFYLEKYLGLAEARMQMSLGGIKQDLQVKRKLQVDYFKEILYTQAQLNILVDTNLNVKSVKQMRKFLYEDLRLPRQYNKNGVLTTDENAILHLTTVVPDSKALYLAIKVRQLRTAYSNNIITRIDSDGRFRSSYGFTETGRLRSSSCPLGTGSNAQNIPPKMRIMFVCDSDEDVLIEADCSQAELRVTLHTAEAWHILKRMEAGQDIYRWIARSTFEKPEEMITEEERYSQKRVVLGANYDLHGRKFARVYNKDAVKLGYPFIDVKKATRLLEMYHEFVPEIRNTYHREIMEELKRTKTLYNSFGRRITFHDRIGDEMFRSGYAWKSQSEIGDLTNTIFRRSHDDEGLKSLVVKILNQIHDALLFNTKKKNAEKLIERVREIGKIPLKIKGRDLFIPIEFKMGKSWGTMMKIKV